MSRAWARVAALVAVLVLSQGRPALAQEAHAFMIDGVGYPRSLFDRRVEARLGEAGRNLQATRHPSTLQRVQQEVLNRLIEEQLLAAEASRRGVVVSEAAIDAAIAAGAAAPWVPPDGVRRQVGDDLRINAIVKEIAAGIRIDDARVDERLREAGRPLGDAQARAAAASQLRTEALAAAVQQQIDALRARAVIDVRVRTSK